MGKKISTWISEIISFFTKDFSGIVFVITTLLYSLTIFSLQFNPFILYFILLLNFSSFDRIGWYHMGPLKGDQIIGYRIIQHGYLILIGASLFHIDACVSISFLVSWYMGVCDFLYYIIGREYGYVKYTNMYWLWWCPWAYFKVPKTGINLTLFSVLTILFCAILLLN